MRIIPWLGFVGYALLVTYLYPLTLKGPMLLGFREFAIGFIVAFLGGAVGSALVWLSTGLITKKTSGITKEYKRRVMIVLVVSAVVAGAFYLGHLAVFDGKQQDYSDGEILLYRVWSLPLSAAMKAFLDSVLAAAQFVLPAKEQKPKSSVMSRIKRILFG